jgi:hypothetical protein
MAAAAAEPGAGAGVRVTARHPARSALPSALPGARAAVPRKDRACRPVFVVVAGSGSWCSTKPAGRRPAK